jgi:hypothetical protein
VRFDPGWVAIPTCNEAENLRGIVAAARAAMATAVTGVAGSVLAVDDIQAVLYHHGGPQRRDLIGREGQDWLAAARSLALLRVARIAGWPRSWLWIGGMELLPAGSRAHARCRRSREGGLVVGGRDILVEALVHPMALAEEVHLTPRPDIGPSCVCRGNVPTSDVGLVPPDGLLLSST